MTDSIRRLHDAVRAVRKGGGHSPRTTRLFNKGRGFIAKKVAEEAVEVGLEGVLGNTRAVVNESADLIYNLVVLWAELGIAPDDVWNEMRRREQWLGMAEKLPKSKHARGKRRSRGPAPVSEIAAALLLDYAAEPDRGEASGDCRTEG